MASKPLPGRVWRALRDGLSSLRDRAAARLAGFRFNPSRAPVAIIIVSAASLAINALYTNDGTDE